MKKNNAVNSIGTYQCRHLTPWERFIHKTKMFFKKVLIVMAGLGVIGCVGFVSYAFGQVANTPMVTNIVGDYIVPPVLQRIAQCESGNSQLSSTGQVLLHWNKNGTVDVGKYAINTVWFKQASELHYDLTKPADNLQFALWLYQNKGTGAWTDSEGCWNK